MTDRDVLLALALRCEAATGPDRELDIRIGWEMDGEGYSDADVQYVVKNRHAAGVTPYTASIDAALSLVPEGWRWIADGDGNATCLPCHQPGIPVEHIHAATPALAICAAALRALACNPFEGSKS